MNTYGFKNWLLTMAFIFCSFCMVTAAASGEVIRLSQPVNETPDYEEFGTPVNTNLPEVSLTALLDNQEQFQDKAFTLKTEIAKVCQRKGCFFIAREKQHAVRVAFKDYEFFIPTDSTNKTVVLNGVLKNVVRSQEQADHFTSDMGEGVVRMQTGETVEIVASAIRIPRS